jgi:hypothetical protein
MEKKCFKCGQVKDIDSFYKHKAMKDGHLGKCIDCAKNDVNEYRVNNLELVRAYDRARSLSPKRKEGVKKRAPRYYKKYLKVANQYPEKRQARTAVSNGLVRGKIKREPCVKCGATERIHAHHEDYNKPLDVIWLCTDHHGERHREINEERRRAIKIP